MVYEVKPPEMKVEYGGPDKVQVVAHPRLQPATCILCGAPGDGRPFVDIGCFIEWYGAVYFCSYCMVDISNHLGYYTPSQYDLVTEQLTSALSENHILAGQNDHYRDILRTTLSLGPHELSDFILRFNEYSQWRESQAPIAVHADPERSDDSTITEQVASEGSTDISDSGEYEQLSFDFDK